MDIQAELERGGAHYSAGRLGEAARCYKQVLLAEPGNADALNFMSALACQGGELEVAVSLARDAIRNAPEWFAPYVNLGNGEQALGRLENAELAFRAAIELNPSCAEAYCNLANVLNARGHHDAAVLMAAKAVALDATLPEGHNNFGNALLALGSADEAATCYRRALAFRPEFGEAWYNLGGACTEMGDSEGAVDALSQAVAQEPRSEWRFKLANALAACRRYAEAEAEYRLALEGDAHNVQIITNLANVLNWQGRLDEGIALLQDAVARLPDAADIHWNLALALLRRGRMQEAWPHYEWRWRMEAFQPYVRDFQKPQWSGEDLQGRTILVHTEQGFGDAIQFSRFAPLLAARGAKVVLECRKGLGRLFATLGENIQPLELGETKPEFDLTVPLLSLGERFGATLATLPQPPYLAVPQGAADFSDVAGRPGLKVGLVWSGSATRARNVLRSLKAAEYNALMDVPGVAFFGLQLGAAEHPVGGTYTDLAPRLKDFADTAAAIQALDLVITVDTAVAHLAGALGKPVWVVLSTPCDGYFWMVDRADSPWYPSARLFRQREEGQWPAVMAEIRHELECMGTMG